MKFLTWNVNHRSQKKEIPPQIAESLISLEPDFIILTEYVPGPSHKRFMADLGSSGYHCKVSSPDAVDENHIFVAAKIPFTEGEIQAPKLTVTSRSGKIQEATSLPSNVFHIKIPQPGFNILGVRIPDYSEQPLLRKACWDWLHDTTRKIHDEPFVILGDFNVDPCNSPKYFQNCFNQITREGWQHMDQPGKESWWSAKGYGKRLDHALLSRHFQRRSSEYKTTSGKYVFARGPGAMSDHAVLFVDAWLK